MHEGHIFLILIGLWVAVVSVAFVVQFVLPVVVLHFLAWNHGYIVVDRSQDGHERVWLYDSGNNMVLQHVSRSYASQWLMTRDWTTDSNDI